MIYKMIYLIHTMNNLELKVLDKKSFLLMDSVDENIDEKIKIVLRQTNYTEEEAKEKLAIFYFDEIKCIKDYLGISDKPKVFEKKTSVNQQIYKELRNKMGIVTTEKLKNINGQKN